MMNTTTLTATGFRCARCGRVQRAARVCGLCGAVPLPMPLPELAAVPELSVRVASAVDVGHRGTPPRPPLIHPSPRTRRQASPRPVDVARTVSLAGVVPERVERVGVGGGVDRVFGGGLPLRRVVLLGGARGTGKTTLVVPWAIRVARATGRTALYVSAEGQSPAELAALVPAGLDPAGVEITSHVELEIVLSLARTLGAGCLVLDSLQSIAVAGTRPGSDDHARRGLGELSSFAKDVGAIVVAISQMNADGRMRGSQIYQQLCDTIAMLERDEDRIALRIDGKNRGGPTDRRAWFHFDDNGALREVDVDADATFAT